MRKAETVGAVHTHTHTHTSIITEAKNCWTVWRAIFYRTWDLRTWKANSTEKITQDGIVSSKNLGLVLVQKIYIKYKNLKDGLCKKIARPFCVQKGVMDTS